MLKIPYGQLIALIEEKGSLDKAAIESKIKAKMDQLAGLISKEGAAHIIANELGISLHDASSGDVKIADLAPGMKGVTVTGKITAVYELKTFSRNDGGAGQVSSFMIADESGRTRVVLWNDLAPSIAKYAQGSVVTINDPYIKESRYGAELHCNSSTTIETSEKSIDVAAQPKATRSQIEALTGTEGNIELLGTIVQAFEPRFYTLKNKRPEDTRDEGVVMNCVLDDGTGTIRCVFFRNLVNTLTGLDEEKVFALKEAPESFEETKNKLLGTIVKLAGRVQKNEMFERLEFVASAVDTAPDAKEELARLSTN